MRAGARGCRWRQRDLLHRGRAGDGLGERRHVCSLKRRPGSADVRRQAAASSAAVSQLPLVLVAGDRRRGQRPAQCGQRDHDELVWNDAAAQLDPPVAAGRVICSTAQLPARRRTQRPCRPRCVSMLWTSLPGYAIYCSANEPNCVSDLNSDPLEALGGTSAATPLLAGGLAIIDEKLKAAHKQPLGLVNLLLYAILRSDDPGVSNVTHLNDVGLDIGNHRRLAAGTARAWVTEALRHREHDQILDSLPRRSPSRRSRHACARPAAEVPGARAWAGNQGDRRVLGLVRDRCLRARLYRPRESIRGELICCRLSNRATARCRGGSRAKERTAALRARARNGCDREDRGRAVQRGGVRCFFLGSGWLDRLCMCARRKCDDWRLINTVGAGACRPDRRRTAGGSWPVIRCRTGSSSSATRNGRSPAGRSASRRTPARPPACRRDAVAVDAEVVTDLGVRRFGEQRSRSAPSCHNLSPPDSRFT